MFEIWGSQIFAEWTEDQESSSHKEVPHKWILLENEDFFEKAEHIL